MAWRPFASTSVASATAKEATRRAKERYRTSRQPSISSAACRAVDGKRVGLAGYSFGSGMILKGLPQYKDARAFALISPPPRFFPESALPKDSRPKLVVCGDQDRTVSLEDLSPFAESMSQPAEYKIIEGADHFWGSLVIEAAGHVSDFFAANLK